MGSKSFLELYRAHSGYVCDKWEQYLAVYDAELGQMVARGTPLNLLEIGVQNGGSLEIWAKLLPAGSQIIGLDIDPYCAELMMPANVRVLIGDASDADFLRASLDDQEFDIIIDDGSHRSHDIVSQFRSLFPRLRPGGKYFIEDLHASYWSEFGGSFRGADSAIEFLKSLVDALHADHFRDAPGADGDVLAELAALNRQIARLSFIDSLAVIEKYPQEKAQPFVRTIAGSQVELSTTAWRNYLVSWSTPLVLFDDQVRRVLDADTKQEVARLGAETTRYQAQLAAVESAAGQLREQLAATERALAQASGLAHDVDEKLHEQEHEFQLAQGKLHEQEEEFRLVQGKLQEREQEFRLAQGQLQEREQELRLAQGALEVERQRRERVRHELDEVRKKRDELRGRLKNMKSSLGWRLSWPIRKIERLFK